MMALVDEAPDSCTRKHDTVVTTPMARMKPVDAFRPGSSPAPGASHDGDGVDLDEELGG
jgi:hypothetical protein